MSTPLKVAYLGNYGEHNTESHVARALEYNGHEVIRVQENTPTSFDSITQECGDVDFVLWTRTGWDWNHVFGSKDGDAIAHARQYRMLDWLRRRHIPSVAFHLDRWVDLDRKYQLATEPFFSCDLVITADGGNDDRFKALGINHYWMPPGVSRAECEPGMFRDEFHSKLAFVGSWQGHYHKEHQHRFELVEWLRKNFKRDCAFWPKEGQPAVRGAALRDLYASVDVVIGDSCFAGSPKGAYYWSDRIPETLGRGGYLLHPRVTGLSQHFNLLEHDEPVTYDTGHLAVWDAGDWEALGDLIEWSLGSPDERRATARRGREHVIQHHTYEVRVQQLVELLTERELLK